MKNYIRTCVLTVSILTVALISSCGEDDGTTAGNSFEFLNQNLQGQIDGITFTFGEGRVEASTGNELSFDLYDASETEAACDLFFGESVSVFFFVPNEVGVYELSLDLSTFDGQTVTLFNPDGAVNSIASQGAVEIISISETEVTGRIDARLDENSSVNGNFTARFCG